MQDNVTFSIFKIENIDKIETLYNELKEKSKTFKEEGRVFYSTIINKKTELIEWEFQNEKYKYFSIVASMERPTKNKRGKSIKEVEVLFYTNIEGEVYILPIFKEVATHIVMRNILSSEINYKFHQIIPEEKKSLFISWLYSHENDKILSVNRELSLNNIKAYKCVSDDQKGIFKGKSESSISCYLEPMQVMIFDYGFNYLKLSITHKTCRYELIISFTEKDNYRIFYNYLNFTNKLFGKVINKFELIIFETNVLIPILYTAFLESSWDKKELLKQNLKLTNTIIESMMTKKKDIEEDLENIKNNENNLEIKKEENALLPLF